MSLASTVRDWCDTLDQTVFDHLFPNGTEKILEILKNATNDESTLVARLAKAVTGLRAEDWNSRTISVYKEKLEKHKKTAETYHRRYAVDHTVEESNYTITFVDNDGGTTTRSFERIETSSRGKLLYNQISRALTAMGQAISEQEKRQIIMEILKELC